jgi:pyruvate dehydrogenase E2 component (dihydrolipoamide acetyltransferase)
MPTNVIMPALGMAQESGTLVRWLKAEGAAVAKGEAIAEIMTDKATVELEAPANGVLGQITAAEGAEVPVGHVIARVLESGEQAASPSTAAGVEAVSAPEPANAPAAAVPSAAGPQASPLAARLAAEHHVDLAAIPAQGKRIEKADVLAYVQSQQAASTLANGAGRAAPVSATGARLQAASPKARRLASEQGREVSGIAGSGPFGAVLAADVLATARGGQPTAPAAVAMSPDPTAATASSEEPGTRVGTIWRIMADRTTQSWTQVPHFFLLREVDASRLISWRERLRQDAPTDANAGITYTDLLVKLVAVTLRSHPRLNSSWETGRVVAHREVNIGLAVAVEDGLVVPVMHRADTLSLGALARRRVDIVARAQAGKLRPDDLAGATFTISNLGMYGVDAFTAIIVAPQAAILAVGRIADRVVPVRGAPTVRPMMALSLSCDHRVVDGARGAQFLGALADMIEEPLGLLAELGG